MQHNSNFVDVTVAAPLQIPYCYSTVTHNFRMNNSDESNSHLVDSMTSNFFKNINMNKLEYRNKATNVISRNYNPYISPYALPDPATEKHFRTDLIKVMSASMENIASTGFTIERFPKGSKLSNHFIYHMTLQSTTITLCLTNLRLLRKNPHS